MYKYTRMSVGKSRQRKQWKRRQMAKKRQKSSNNNRKTVKNDTKYNGKFQTSTQTTGRFRLE